MKKLISLFLATLTVLGVLCAPVYAAEEDGPTLENLGIPMSAVISDSSQYLYGRSVWDITSYNGKIYIGGGEYNVNAGNALGGIPIYAYDPAAGTWQREHTVSDEQPSRFFSEWGNLYIPGTDPIAGSEGELHYLKDGAWGKNNSIIYGTHVFDALFLDDEKTVFLGLGSGYGIPPTVSMSTDGGNKFKSINFRKDGVRITRNNLKVGADSDTSNIYCRVYNVFEYDGDVYASVWVNTAPEHAAYKGLYKYNEEEKIFDYYCPTHNSLIRNSMSQSYDLTFNGTFVSSYHTLTAFSEDLKSWRELTGFEGSATCARVVGEYMYFTTYEMKDANDPHAYVIRMYRTADLENMELVYSFEYGSYVRSFCYDRGTFYLGTEGTRGNPSNDTGTVFSLTFNDSECTHGNTVSAFQQATAGNYGRYSRSCPDCGKVEYEGTFPFTDVENRWYLESVIRAFESGLMNGTAATAFDPNGTTTRGQVVTVLYNLEGKPDVSAEENPFTDVENGRYYTSPVKWAYKNGVVTGVSDTAFDPTAQITREQFAAILYRYAKYKGADVSAQADMSVYTDSGEISNYAKVPLSWANATGLITGISSTVISPKGGATRAQMATILIRYTDAIPQ